MKDIFYLLFYYNTFVSPANEHSLSVTEVSCREGSISLF